MQYFDESLREQPFAVIGRRLHTEVESAEPRLREISDERASAVRAPGKWTRKEIVGHLIDSAANNHQRFVRAQEGALLRLPGYAQEGWVTSQRYQERSWGDLIDLWGNYNRHLADVISVIPESLRDLPCEIGDNPSVTLSHLALDYLGHAQHHLEQVFS